MCTSSSQINFSQPILFMYSHRRGLGFSCINNNIIIVLSAYLHVTISSWQSKFGFVPPLTWIRINSAFWYQLQNLNRRNIRITHNPQLISKSPQIDYAISKAHHIPPHRRSVTPSRVAHLLHKSQSIANVVAHKY